MEAAAGLGDKHEGDFFLVMNPSLLIMREREREAAVGLVMMWGLFSSHEY